MIGTEGTFAPFSYHDDNDNLVGYDVEVSEALAKELGVKVKWDSLIAGLDSDKYDLVTNQVAITAERKNMIFQFHIHTLIQQLSLKKIIQKSLKRVISKDINFHKQAWFIHDFYASLTYTILFFFKSLMIILISLFFLVLSVI